MSLMVFSLLHRWHARLLILLVALGAAIAGLMSPLFQKVFVDRLLDSTIVTHGISGAEWLESVSPLWMIGLAFLCTLFAQGLSLLAGYLGFKEGIILQSIFSERLYRKMLSIRTDDMKDATVGEVVSIYATDVAGATAIVDQAIPMAASIVFPVVFAPLLIQWLCGIPLGATILVMISIVAMNMLLGARQSIFFNRFKHLAAERTAIVNEWVQNIRLLRILGWVETFEAKIFGKRIEETANRVAMVTNGQLMNSFGSSISFVINLVGVASLIFYRKTAVSPGELFALLWVFGVFLAKPFRQLPWLFVFSIDAMTSMRRLEKYLARTSDPWIHELESKSVKSSHPVQSQASLDLEVRGMNLQIDGHPVLRDVNFSVRAGEFVAIVGEVGSGKSLLLLSLVGETGAKFERFKLGHLDMQSLNLNERRRKFSFVPQEGFVMSASLRENIVFRYDTEDSGLNDETVEKSLELAQFSLANEQVERGLDTEIGERGVNLSGGQRQRVSLARAHHFGRPVVLLDDCLSAVDVDTENLLIRDLIDGAWKGATRVLVTHRLTVLSKVDRIFFMEEGCIVESGTFNELIAKSERMKEFVASVRRSEAQAEGADPAEVKRESRSVHV